MDFYYLLVGDKCVLLTQNRPEVVYRTFSYLCDYIDDTGNDVLFKELRDWTLEYRPQMKLDPEQSIYGHLENVRGWMEDVYIKEPEKLFSCPIPAKTLREYGMVLDTIGIPNAPFVVYDPYIRSERGYHFCPCFETFQSREEATTFLKRWERSTDAVIIEVSSYGSKIKAAR